MQTLVAEHEELKKVGQAGWRYYRLYDSICTSSVVLINKFQVKE